ncbi:MAG: site-2 protease family protein [Chlamydiae bacterium]|nr:site-2 protease family protein [Chlamydiota bacterium]
MIRIPGKIPVNIHGGFWLVAAIIGFLNSGSFLGTIIWIGVIFISVLVHEFGHATTALFFGLKPRIDLIALGGLTYHKGEHLPFWKQFFIVLNGPLFGFFLFVLAFFLLKIPFFSMGIRKDVIFYFYWVNLVWTILNLVPVLPLDGGQLLRIVFESIFGAKGFKYSLLSGSILAGLLSLAFFLFQQYLIGALFFLFAFQSYDTWRKVRPFSERDRRDDLKEKLEKAEQMLKMGQKDYAAEEFMRIRNEAKEGMIYTLATQYLAFIDNDLGKTKEAYDLLQIIRQDLSSDGLCLLHKVAFEQRDYALVADLAGPCFQIMPAPEVALRNAFACGNLSQVKPAVGWLETAFQEGLENVDEIASEKHFDSIRSDPLFQNFLEHHKSM